MIGNAIVSGEPLQAAAPICVSQSISEPMRIAYLECFSGISGDMFLGALVDAGVPFGLLDQTATALNVGARLECTRVQRSGISATKVDVWIGGEKDQPRDVVRGQHSEKRQHSHGIGVKHGDHQHYRHEHRHGRGMKEIRKIIEAAPISTTAKQLAISMFQALGAAEAKIHNVDIDRIHFHEVGAADAIVDIVCAAAGAEALAVDEWICSPLNVGGGSVKCAHGTFPVPAPAVLELLAGAPTYSSGVQKEFVTPTGAAIVRALASRFGEFPAMKITGAGYGAGTQEIPGQPNVLRITIGETEQAATSAGSDVVTVLEANIDDLNPQVFGYVVDRLLAEGALDVFGTPVQMKKGRPGMLLSVIARPADTQRFARLIFAETTTLGVRIREQRREVLSRREVAVHTRWGDVRMKIASMNGTVANYAPEFEDCRQIATQHSVPLKEVMQEAIHLYLEQQNG